MCRSVAGSPGLFVVASSLMEQPDNPLAVVVTHGHSLAEAIVDTVREPLVVLDRDLRVIAASRSFYRTFAAEPQDTQGRRLYELGDGQWNIPSSADGPRRHHSETPHRRGL